MQTRPSRLYLPKFDRAPETIFQYLLARFPQVDALENDHAFMVDLMTKWVERLNSDDHDAKKKLKGPVQCITCHETDPRKQ